MSGIGRARWIFFGATELSSSEAELGDVNGLRPDIFRRPTEHRPVTVRSLSQNGSFFCRCGSNYRPEIGRTSEGIPPVPEQVTGHRAIAGRFVNGLWTMTGRCSSDVTRTCVPSYSVLPTWHCQFITMAAPRRLRMVLFEHELAQARFQYNLVLAAILEAAERERQRARRREKTLVGVRVDPTQTPFRPVRDSHEGTRGRACCRLQSLPPYWATDVLWVA